MKKLYEMYGPRIFVIPAVVVAVLLCLTLIFSGKDGGKGNTVNKTPGETVHAADGETGGKREEPSVSVPRITLEVPDKSMEQEIVVTGTVEDANGVVSVIVKVGDREFEAILEDDGTWSAMVKLASGDNTVSATVTNTAGNTASVHGKVFVDPSLPSLKVNTLPNITKDNQIVLSGLATADAGIRSLVVTVNENEYNVLLNEDGTWSVDVALEVGNNEIVVLAAGANGKTISERDSIIYDNASPELTVFEIPEFMKEMNVTVSGLVYDANGVASVTVNGKEVAVKDDGSWAIMIPLAEGEAAIDVVATDKAGNRIRVARATIIDITPPELISSDPPALTSNAKISLTGILKDDHPIDFVKVNDKKASMKDDGSWSFELELKEGDNVITIKGADKAGNEVTKSYTVTLDATAPELTVKELEDLTSSSFVTVSGTAKDVIGFSFLNVNGKNVELNSDGTWSVQVELFEGQNYISVLAMDKAGNSTVYSESIIKDTIAPTLVVHEAVPGATDGRILVSGVVSDANGVASVVVNGVSAALNSDGAWEVEIAAGDSTIDVVATDYADNVISKTVEVGTGPSEPSEPAGETPSVPVSEPEDPPA